MGVVAVPRPPGRGRPGDERPGDERPAGQQPAGQRPAATRPPGLPSARPAHHPGLDGLRAIALLAVMAFHHGYGGARGGYLGVSSFFTLSGFLIATVAIDERRRTGRLSWRRFWERRARRLLPAALVTLAGVLALQAWAGTGAGPRFRGDVLAALGYAANWRLATGAGGYADLFGAPTPVVHFWSLAIEEQFYLVFPPAFAAAAALGRRVRGGAAAAFGGAAVASFLAAAATAGRSGDDGLAYYGTHTRAGELLVGVVLACAVASPRGRRLAARIGGGAVAARSARGATPVAAARAGPAPLAPLAALAALAGLVALWATVAVGDPRLFRGVTGVNAALTAVVIVVVVHHPGVDRALGVAPLRAVGRVSYGAYLFHWPLFLVLAPPLVTLEGHALFAVRLVATLAAATLSYVVVEAPFRFRLSMPHLRLAVVMAAGVAVVAGAAVALPRHPGTATDDSAVLALGPVDDARAIAAVTPPGGLPATGTVFLAGDSVAWSLRPAFHFWNHRGGEHTFQVDTHLAFGCPVGGAGTVRLVAETVTPPECDTWHDGLPAALARSSPDVVVIEMGLADLNGRRIDGEWRDLGDPRHDRWLRGRIDEVATLLEAPGVPVVWLTFPHVRMRDPADPTRAWADLPINDPARVDRFNALLAEALADHPRVRLVDLAGWLATWPGGSFDPDDRDGVHFTYTAADRVGAWLIPQVLELMPAAPPAGGSGDGG